MGDWAAELIRGSGYAGVALLMLLETVFPPIPSELVMGLAGVEASRGSMTLWGTILAGIVGAMAGNIAWYWLARRIGVERLRPFIERHGRWLTLHWRDVTRAECWFDIYGAGFVSLGRMLPTIRSLVSIPAGLLHMNWRRFLFWSTLGTAGWTSLLAVVGHHLGSEYGDIEKVSGPVSTAILVVLVAGYAWRVWRWKPD